MRAINTHSQRAEKDKEVAMLGQTISKLKSELHEITRTNEVEVATIEKTAKENVDNARAQHSVRVEELKSQTEKLLDSLKKMCSENAETEAVLRKRKTKFETDLTNRISMYDNEMSSKQSLIDSLTLKYNKEKEALKELQEHFDLVDTNRQTADNEVAYLKMVADMERKAIGILDDAAVKVQKRIRGIIDRVVVAKLKKKSKKGKKKGKKK